MSNFCADGHYIPIGGQHISAALLSVYKSLGGNEDDIGIPAELQFVDAEVLRPNTPRDICRLAAGDHHVAQKDVQSMSVSDIFKLMCQTAREKLAKHQTKVPTDNEVHTVCLQCGLQKLRDRTGKELTPQHEVSNISCMCVSDLFCSVTEDIADPKLSPICLLGISVV